MIKNRRKIIYTIFITAVMIILAAGSVTLYVVLEETLAESRIKIREREMKKSTLYVMKTNFSVGSFVHFGKKTSNRGAHHALKTHAGTVPL